MDKADKKQISRHTSICISSFFFPPIYLSHSHPDADTLFFPNTQTPKDKLHSKRHDNTDAGEWMCRQAAFTLKTGVSACAVLHERPS